MIILTRDLIEQLDDTPDGSGAVVCLDETVDEWSEKITMMENWLDEQLDKIDLGQPFTCTHAHDIANDILNNAKFRFHECCAETTLLDQLACVYSESNQINGEYKEKFLDRFGKECSNPCTPHEENRIRGVERVANDITEEYMNLLAGRTFGLSCNVTLIRDDHLSRLNSEIRSCCSTLTENNPIPHSASLDCMDSKLQEIVNSFFDNVRDTCELTPEFEFECKDLVSLIEDFEDRLEALVSDYDHLDPLDPYTDCNKFLLDFSTLITNYRQTFRTLTGNDQLADFYHCDYLFEEPAEEAKKRVTEKWFDKCKPDSVKNTAPGHAITQL